jgi:hypothetical protein
MAFIVEDGDGLANSNSYESVAEFNAYCALRGLEITANYNDTDKQRALVKGTEYIDLVKGPHFKGRRLLSTQALKFPRACLRDPEFHCVFIEGIPDKLKNALSEYAYLEMTNPGSLMPNPETDASGLQLQSISETVGPIEEKKVFLASSVKTVKVFPKADRYLVDYMYSSTGGTYRA